MEACTTLARFRSVRQSTTARAVVQENVGRMLGKYSRCGSFNERFPTIARQLQNLWIV